VHGGIKRAAAAAAAAVKRLVFLCSMQSASIIFLRRFENHFVFWDKNQIICSNGNQLLASRTKENAVSLACAVRLRTEMLLLLLELLHTSNFNHPVRLL
jgi:hypothetical protein